MSEIRFERIWEIEDRIKKEFKINIFYIEAIYLDKDDIFKRFNDETVDDNEILKGVTKEEIDIAFNSLLSRDYIIENVLYNKYSQYKISDSYRKYLESH